MKPNKQYSRRRFLKTSACFSATVSTAIIGLTCLKKHKRPNIIFFLTDDQRWDMLGCTGNPIIKTPNIDALAHDGVIFDNAFVTTAICCTSRASIFLGQYARRHGINDFSTDFTTQQLDMCYDMQLKRAGYRIGFIGKYGVGNTMPEKQYDFWRGVAGQPVYEHKDQNGHYIHYTRLCEQHTLEFLKSNPKDQPFCLSVSFKAPHVQDIDPRQFISDPAYDNLYQDVTIPLPKKAHPSYKERLPDFMKSEQSMHRVRWNLRFASPDMYQNMVKGYYRLITGVDVVVGEIFNQLKKLKYADNTIIVFLGDNGFYLGEWGFAGKWYGHEESIRVPLVIYDPRLPKKYRGVHRQEMALNIDISPTIVDFAGLPVSDSVQGKSLLPLITGESLTWRQDFFYEHLFKVPEKSIATVGYIPSSIGVRTTKYKYLRYIDQNPVYEELYDLEKDPLEESNQAGNPGYTDRLENLRILCDKMKEEKK